MVKATTSIILVLVTIYFVPFVVYSVFSVVSDLEPPKGPPALFLTSVFVSKAGTAIAFVLIFYVARDSMTGRWLLYAFLWWLMFSIGEIGQAIAPKYTWKEALAGVISETIYFPASAYVTNRLVGRKSTVGASR